MFGRLDDTIWFRSVVRLDDAIWFVAIGFGRIAGGLAALGTPGAGLTIVNGAVSLLLGILIAEELPESSDWAIGLLVGIDFLFFGVSCLFLAAAAGPSAPQPAGGSRPS